MSDAKEKAPPASERIDVNDEAAVERWTQRLNVTRQQIRDAVEQVGNLASDVEMHLKGARSSTNDDQIERHG